MKILCFHDNQGASQDQEAGESHGAPQAEAPSTPVKSPRSKQVLPAIGTIESIDLDGVSQSVPRLDNTAAKHKLSVKPKNQRISRKHRRFTQVRGGQVPYSWWSFFGMNLHA